MTAGSGTKHHHTSGGFFWPKNSHWLSAINLSFQSSKNPITLTLFLFCGIILLVKFQLHISKEEREKMLRKIWKDESGQDLIEYAMVVALLVIFLTALDAVLNNGRTIDVVVDLVRKAAGLHW